MAAFVGRLDKPGARRRRKLPARLTVIPPQEVGRPLRAVAALVNSWNFQEAAVGMTALNAACNTMMLIPKSPLREASGNVKGCASDLFLPRIKDKRVTVVGHFPPLEKLCTHCTLSILERNPRSDDLPDMAAEYILPDQNAVFITGTTFTNKTITRLPELTRKAEVSMVGRAPT